MHVRVVVVPLIGDLSIHFTQCRRGCKRKTAIGSKWEELVHEDPFVQAETVFLFV